MHLGCYPQVLGCIRLRRIALLRASQRTRGRFGDPAGVDLIGFADRLGLPTGEPSAPIDRLAFPQGTARTAPAPVWRTDARIGA